MLCYYAYYELSIVMLISSWYTCRKFLDVIICVLSYLALMFYSIAKITLHLIRGIQKATNS